MQCDKKKIIPLKTMVDLNFFKKESMFLNGFPTLFVLFLKNNFWIRQLVIILMLSDFIKSCQIQHIVSDRFQRFIKLSGVKRFTGEDKRIF